MNSSEIMGLKRRKLPAYLPICLPAYMPTCLPAHMSTYLPSYLPNLHVDESATLMITNVYALRKKEYKTIVALRPVDHSVSSATTFYLEPRELVFTLR